MADTHTGPLDVLVTDVVMPRLDGREVAARVTARRPETRVLFVSGYPDGPPLEGVAFMPKPFTPAVLIARVRDLLAGP